MLPLHAHQAQILPSRVCSPAASALKESATLEYWNIPHFVVSSPGPHGLGVRVTAELV